MKTVNLVVDKYGHKFISFDKKNETVCASWKMWIDSTTIYIEHWWKCGENWYEPGDDGLVSWWGEGDKDYKEIIEIIKKYNLPYANVSGENWRTEENARKVLGIGSMKTVKLTDEQYIMVQNCIEHISANERSYSMEAEKTLKEVSEIFNASYEPEANILPKQS